MAFLNEGQNTSTGNVDNQLSDEGEEN